MCQPASNFLICVFHKNDLCFCLLEVSIPICCTASAQDLQTTLIVEQQVQLFEMAAKFQITDILPSYLELVHSSMLTFNVFSPN